MELVKASILLVAGKVVLIMLRIMITPLTVMGEMVVTETCFARGESGGDHNSGNHGNSDNGNGGNAGDNRRCGPEFCTPEGGKGGSSNLFSNYGDGIFWPIVLTLVWL
jgi:hypothetical protein